MHKEEFENLKKKKELEEEQSKKETKKPEKKDTSKKPIEDKESEEKSSKKTKSSSSATTTSSSTEDESDSIDIVHKPSENEKDFIGSVVCSNSSGEILLIECIFVNISRKEGKLSYRVLNKSELNFEKTDKGISITDVPYRRIWVKPTPFVQVFLPEKNYKFNPKNITMKFKLKHKQNPWYVNLNDMIPIIKKFQSSEGLEGTKIEFFDNLEECSKEVAGGKMIISDSIPEEAPKKPQKSHQDKQPDKSPKIQNRSINKKQKSSTDEEQEPPKKKENKKHSNHDDSNGSSDYFINSNAFSNAQDEEKRELLYGLNGMIIHPLLTKKAKIEFRKVTNELLDSMMEQ